MVDCHPAQNKYAKHWEDCCLNSAGSGPCDRPCEQRHMTANCKCADGYEFNPATHVCEGKYRLRELLHCRLDNTKHWCVG